MVRRIGSLRGGERVRKAEKFAAWGLGAISSFPLERLVSFGGRGNPTSEPTEKQALPSKEDQTSSPGSMQRVPIICVYCKAERKAKGLPPKILGYVMMKVPSVVKDPTSDGICAECEAKYFPGVDTSAPAFQNPGGQLSENKPGNPQYGPIGKVTPSQKVDWEEALRETKEELPLDHPALLEEARRAGASPAEMQVIIAGLKYKEKRERLLRRYIREEEATPAGRRELERERREEARERREEEEEADVEAKVNNPVEIAHRATSGHPQTREGTPSERIAYQEGEIWINLWLLEGHLKQACGNCGGDEECCAKHSAGLVGLARETQSMTTDPRLDQVITVAQEVFPRVQPDDVKAGTHASEYPALVVKVSEVRSRFNPPHAWVMGEQVRLEGAKEEAARIAAEEVEKQWHSPTPK